MTNLTMKDEKRFDIIVLEDHGSRFSPIPETVVMDQFDFERTEETLSDCIVPTVGSPTQINHKANLC